MLPSDEGAVAKWIAGIFSGLLGGALIIWKLLLNVRKDARTDGADALIDRGQKAEISRLHELVEKLSQRVDAEIEVRRQMVDEMATLRRRADHAESAAELAYGRQRAAEEEVQLHKAQIAALEMHVARLERGQRPEPPMFRDEI